MADVYSRRTRPSVGVVGVFLFYFSLPLLAIILGVVLEMVVGSVLNLFWTPSEGSLLVLLLVSQAVGFIAVSVLFIYRSDTNISAINWSLPSTPDIIYVGVGVVGLVLLSGSLSLVDRFIHPVNVQEGTELYDVVASDPTIVFVFIPILFFLAAPAEEILFRGLIQHRLISRFDSVTGIVATSIIFTIFHIPPLFGIGMVLYSLVVFLLSLIICLSYEHTENLFVPVLIHAIFNTVQMTVLYLAVA